MQEVRVSETSGVVLDWLIGKALGKKVKIEFKKSGGAFSDAQPAVVLDGVKYSPSEDWSALGEIIHGYGITVANFNDRPVERRWCAYVFGCLYDVEHGHFMEGSTPMDVIGRCFVSMRLGETTVVPVGLMKAEM